MGINDINSLITKLSQVPYYKPLFNDAFGSNEISADKISLAVSTFIGSITTNNTRFDRYNMVRFDPNQASQADFTSLEIEGMNLFETKYDCNSCHQVQSPNGYIQAGTFANIGLDENYEDPGLEAVTGNTSDNGKFKIPSLRNVDFTAPYMHDGRFETLDEVIDHYSEGIADHPALDPKLQDPGAHARKMNISAHEKVAIIAFLKTLTDASVVSDPKFSNPFKVKR
jgi:cytochrome c peroxidase